MNSENKTSPAKVIEGGTLKQVPLEKILPSENNPRLLFDEAPLQSLKASIEVHGVLVPLTIHPKKGTDRFHIIDGERRYRCCQLLSEEGNFPTGVIPANIVDAPDRLQSLLYMFSIHNFREGWELMPTALGLKDVMEDLKEQDADNKRLRELTGLSEPQIERCRTLLTFPEEFQLLSMEPDVTKRVPSNFWIEAKPVLDAIGKHMPDLEKQYGGRDGVTRRLVEKYNRRAIKSVIHFRRVMDALDMAFGPGSSQGDDSVETTSRRTSEWLKNLDYETRSAFDELILDNRRVRKAIETCAEFKRNLEKLRLNFEIDRQELRDALEDVRLYVADLLEDLKGEDMPLFDDQEEEA